MNSLSDREEVLNVSEGKSRLLPFVWRQSRRTFHPSQWSQLHTQIICRRLLTERLCWSSSVVSPCRRWTLVGGVFALGSEWAELVNINLNLRIWLSPNPSAFVVAVDLFFLFVFAPHVLQVSSRRPKVKESVTNPRELPGAHVEPFLQHVPQQVLHFLQTSKKQSHKLVFPGCRTVTAGITVCGLDSWFSQSRDHLCSASL